MKHTLEKPVSYIQYKSLLKLMSDKDKEKLFFELRKDRFNSLLKQLRNELKNIPISMEEILNEVETVRTQRYENRKRL